jgi:hypothetical protein
MPTSPVMAWNTPARIIMMPANRMKPTAQPVGSASARAADRYCGDACSVMSGPLPSACVPGTAVSVGDPGDGGSVAPGPLAVIIQWG